MWAKLELKDFQLGSARDLFNLAWKQKLAITSRKLAENEAKFDFKLKPYFLINFQNKLD